MQSGRRKTFSETEVELVNTILLASDSAKKIDILEEYLMNGHQISPESAARFVEINHADANLVRFFIQHDACGTIHLIHIFRACSVSICFSREYGMLCLEQENSQQVMKNILTMLTAIPRVHIAILLKAIFVFTLKKHIPINQRVILHSSNLFWKNALN